MKESAFEGYAAGPLETQPSVRREDHRGRCSQADAISSAEQRSSEKILQAPAALEHHGISDSRPARPRSDA